MIQNIKSPVIFGVISMIIGIVAFILNLKLRGEELEKNEAIDKKLLRCLTVKVKDFDLNTNYFSKKEDSEKTEKKEKPAN